MSILILSPWTLYLGSNFPYLVRSVNLSKNLYLQPSVIDTDHPASDYWWDGKFHDKIDLRQKSLSFNATPPSILTLISAPSTSTLTFQHFSTTPETGDPKILLHLPHPSKIHKIHYSHKTDALSSPPSSTFTNIHFNANHHTFRFIQ